LNSITFSPRGGPGGGHPLGGGVLGRSGTPIASWFMNESDVLLVFGASFSNHTGITPKKPIIQVDFDPMSLSRFHPVTVPVWGEIGVTARLLAEQVGAKIKVVRTLQGMDLGVWDGLLESQLMDRFPKAYKGWRERPGSVNPPEGESFDDLSHRLKLAVSKVLEKANGKPVALVLRPFSFGLVNCWLKGRPTAELWSFLDDGPQTVRLRVERELVRPTLESLRAKA